MPAFQDLTGQRFGRLTVVEKGACKNGRTVWACQCDCGRNTLVASHRLKSRHTSSCGCLQKERRGKHNLKHGGYGTPEYLAWAGAISRTNNPKNTRYKDYGGRGISVCLRWRDSFKKFLSDMGFKPSPHHSLDRIDNSLGYSPSNCRWATPSEQSRNRRSNRMLAYRGETKSVAEWSEISGLSYMTIYLRVSRGKMSTAEALETPARGSKP